MAHSVLVVASQEESRRAAFDVLAGLRDHGYSTIVARDGDLESEIQNDIELSAIDEAEGFDGVVFMDDGGDAERCEKIAKKLFGEDKVVAGIGPGCAILANAKILKDKYVCRSLAGEKDAKPVKSPSVRCDNVVTAEGACAVGFLALLIDALGGEIKMVIRSGDVPALPTRVAMVVSGVARWPEYWTLAERLARRGVGLLIADWREINPESGLVNSSFLMNVLSRDLIPLAGHRVPGSVWFKQTSIGIEDSIEAVAALERLGSRNVNSSEAMRLCADKAALGRVLGDSLRHGNPRAFDGRTAGEAARLLSSPGVRWVKPRTSSLGRGVMRVRSAGGTVVVSRRRRGAGPVHEIVPANGLAALLRRAYAHLDFVVQDEVGHAGVGDKTFELRFVMRRAAGGWKPSAEIARFGRLLSNPADRQGLGPRASAAAGAMSVAFPDGWEAMLADAREMARAACVLVQSSLSSPDGVGELAVDVTFDGAEPGVIEINSVPDLTFADEAAAGGASLSALAMAVGREASAQLTLQFLDDEDARGDVADPLAENSRDPLHGRLVLRELGHQGIWPQPDGRIAVGREVMGVDEALKRLRDEAIEAVEHQIECERRPEEPRCRRAGAIARRARHRLLLLDEWHFLTRGDIRTAAYNYSYDTGVAGPFSHLDVPMFERVFEWDEHDDYLRDREKAISDLPRYNPEYTENGFYYIWWEPRREPYEWKRRLTDGTYPHRSILQRGSSDAMVRTAQAEKEEEPVPATEAPSSTPAPDGPVQTTPASPGPPPGEDHVAELANRYRQTGDPSVLESLLRERTPSGATVERHVLRYADLTGEMPGTSVQDAVARAIGARGQEFMGAFELPIDSSTDELDRLAVRMQLAGDDDERNAIFERLLKARVPFGNEIISIGKYVRRRLGNLGGEPDEAEIMIFNAALRARETVFGSLVGELKRMDKSLRSHAPIGNWRMEKAMPRFRKYITPERLMVPEDIADRTDKSDAEKVIEAYKRDKWGGEDRVEAAMEWWAETYNKLIADVPEMSHMPPVTMEGGEKARLNDFKLVKSTFDWLTKERPEIARARGIDKADYAKPGGEHFLLAEMVAPGRYLVVAKDVWPVIDRVRSGGDVPIGAGDDEERGFDPGRKDVKRQSKRRVIIRTGARDVV